VSDVAVTVIRSAAEIAEALSLSSRVFTVEQGDDYDTDPASNERAVHVLARSKGVPVAYAAQPLFKNARVVVEEDAGHLFHQM
jgi:hypothetical protein